jgi:predicted 3-demethylubiquinone-9 3-methyltransferase (glyoxalase superfamily)
MMKIVPCVWFDGTAAKAARLYLSAFRDASVLDESVLNDTPSGDAELINMLISGQSFTLMSAGPEFKPNASISFLVSCNSSSEVDRLWSDLAPQGKELMPLGGYPFSPRYGWIEDRFGISWQLYFAQNQGPRPKIIPTLMFTGNVCGKAQEAMRFWTSIFANSSLGQILPYGTDEGPDAAGTVKHGEFTLEGQLFAAMDSAGAHDFGFTEGLSFQVRCETQDEIDRFWLALSAHPENENCGWLKDKYGVSWQITPRRLEEMMSGGNPERTARVVQRFLKMKKMDIAELERAYEG